MNIDDIKPGYIPSVRTGTDYIKRVNSPLLGAQPEFLGFDWRTVKPALDLQNKNGFESFGCVSWGALQDIEEIINAKIKLKTLPQTHLDFLNKYGYIQNGLVVFSKVFIWVLSGTVKDKGNSFPNVADAIHKNGLIPESWMPFNPIPGATWEQVFVQPTADSLKMGQLFKTYFDIGYQYITDTSITSLKNELLDGPVQVCIPVCPGYNTETPIKSCGLNESHSVIIDYIDPQNEVEIIDHYNPEVKLLDTGYPIPDAMQYVITTKTLNNNTMKLVNYNNTVYRISGVNDIKVVGISAQSDLTDLYGDEPIENVSELPAPATWTETPGYVYHKN